MIPHRLALVCLLSICCACIAAAQDLNGRWSCNDGGVYEIRQIGTEVWWVGRSADNGASFTNVFHGSIRGGRLTGTWADVPAGQARQNGQLNLDIVNANRMTTGRRQDPFGGTEWTRAGATTTSTGGSGAGAGSRCTIQYVDWNGNRQSISLTDGRDIYYKGWDDARWVARLDRNRNVFIHAPNGNFNSSHPDDFMRYRDWNNQNMESPHIPQCSGASTGSNTGTTQGGSGSTSTSASGRCLIQYIDWSGNRQSTGLADGRDIQYMGWDNARWLARLDRTRNAFVHAPNGDFNASHPDDFMRYRTWNGQNLESPHIPECQGASSGSGGGTGGSGATSATGRCLIQYIDWNGNRQSTGLADGRDIQYMGWDNARWLARLDRTRNVFIHAPNGDFNASHPDDFMRYRDWNGQNIESPHIPQCPGGGQSGGGSGAGAGGGSGRGGVGGGGGRGVCDDPRTQGLMDQWLNQANPPENQRTGWRVRYDSWGRLVGRSPSATLTGLPQGVDTRLTRCEYLWSISTNLNSTNLGTLRSYLDRNLR